jgi:hypothetical protein
MSRNRLHKTQLVLLALLTAFHLVLILIVPPEFSLGWLQASIVLCLLIIAVHIFFRQMIGNNDLLSFDILFAVAYFLLNYGYLLPFSLNALEYNRAILWDNSIITRATLMINLGLVAFLFGYTFAIRPGWVPKDCKDIVASLRARPGIWFFAGKLAFLIGLLLIAAFIYQIGPDTLFNRGYSFRLFYSGEYSTSLFGAGKLLVASGMVVFYIQLILTQRLSINNLFFIGLTLAYSAFIFLFGVRSWLILDIGLPLIFALHYIRKRISWRMAGILLLAFLVLYVFIERGRESEVRSISAFSQTLQSSLQEQQFYGWELVSRIGLPVKNVYREYS